VGRAFEGVVATELDPDRLEGLFRIGVDEISWRKHHKYLTLVVHHDRGKVIWGAKGKEAVTLDTFFDELGPERSAQLAAVSLDLGSAFLKSVQAEGHAPQAVVCADPSIWSSWWARPSMRCVGICGTSCGACPTSAGPRTSKAPAGPCSRILRISPSRRPS